MAEPAPATTALEARWRRSRRHQLQWRSQLSSPLVDEAEAPGRRWGRGARSRDRDGDFGYNGRQRSHR